MEIENSSTYNKHVSFVTNEGRLDLKIRKMQLNSWILLNHVEPIRSFNETSGRRCKPFIFHPWGTEMKPASWSRMETPPMSHPFNSPGRQNSLAWSEKPTEKPRGNPWFSIVLHGFYPREVSWLRQKAGRQKEAVKEVICGWGGCFFFHLVMGGFFGLKNEKLILNFGSVSYTKKRGLRKHNGHLSDSLMAWESKICDSTTQKHVLIQRIWAN